MEWGGAGGELGTVTLTSSCPRVEPHGTKIVDPLLPIKTKDLALALAATKNVIMRNKDLVDPATTMLVNLDKVTHIFEYPT